MMNTISTFLRRLYPSTRTPAGHAALVDSLEGRTLLAAGPQVTTAFLDNRGRAEFTFNAKLNARTLTGKSASIYVPGADGKIGTADDTRRKTKIGYGKGVLTLSAKIGTSKDYRVVLKDGIKDTKGRRLDGDFNGHNKRSGNGKAGGAFDVVARPQRAVIYRFTTNMGKIDVAMYRDTPVTMKNFRSYADRAAWDTTFFHRSTRDASAGIQVVQGGGFNVNAQKQIDSVNSGDGVGLELKHSNVKGTIAMARTSDPNSNTNQWFFNVNDNTELNTIGGGYTVFGRVTNKSSQGTINKINNLTIRQGEPGNPNSPFNELPSRDATGIIDVPKDLVMVSRVAMQMGTSKPAAGVAAKRARAKRAPASATAAPAQPTALPAVRSLSSFFAADRTIDAVWG